MPEDNGFYKGQVFDSIEKRFDRQDIKIDKIGDDVTAIKTKLAYMIGYSAGAGAVAALIFQLITSFIQSGKL